MSWCGNFSPDGFFLDVGGNQPQKGSQTWLLEERCNERFLAPLRDMPKMRRAATEQRSEADVRVVVDGPFSHPCREVARQSHPDGATSKAGYQF
jgi:hypothetical protein